MLKKLVIDIVKYVFKFSITVFNYIILKALFFHINSQLILNYKSCYINEFNYTSNNFIKSFLK